MGLDLEWELHAFKGLMALWKRLKPAAAPAFDATRAVHLAGLERRLQVVAQMVAEAPVRVLPAKDAGGVRGLDLLLPPVIDVLPMVEANAGLYVLRAAFGGAMVRCLGNRTVPVDGLDRLALTLDVAADARVLLANELSGASMAVDEAWPLLFGLPRAASVELKPATKAAVIRQWQCAPVNERPWRTDGAVADLRRLKGEARLCPALLLVGDLIPVTADGATAPKEPGSERTQAAPAPTTTKEAPPIAEIRRTVLDQKEQQKSALMHTFEKVETIDTFEGQARDGDGSDELSLHEEALQEVDLRDMIRGGDDAAAMLHADVSLDADIPDVGSVLPGEQGIHYDEWDHRRRAYRTDWCTVYATPMKAREPAFGQQAALKHRRVINHLHDELSRLRHERRPMNRQLDGPDIDIDAFVDDLAAQRAGNSASPRVYARRERHRHALLTTVLLDVSLSSDSWVDGRRVLDVAREVVVVLGEVAARLGDPIEVLAFASETRNHCRVYEVCGRSEPWAVGRDRLGTLRPQGYTRIGPALRHAMARAAAAPASKKLVLLVSDGKPTDYDRYEGRYGIADIRQALREGEQQGIVSHALAIDSTARTHLPEMFGAGAWHVLSDPNRLGEVMKAAWGRVAR